MDVKITKSMEKALVALWLCLTEPGRSFRDSYWGLYRSAQEIGAPRGALQLGAGRGINEHTAAALVARGLAEKRKWTYRIIGAQADLTATIIQITAAGALAIGKELPLPSAPEVKRAWRGAQQARQDVDNLVQDMARQDGVDQDGDSLVMQNIEAITATLRQVTDLLEDLQRRMLAAEARLAGHDAASPLGALPKRGYSAPVRVADLIDAELRDNGLRRASFQEAGAFFFQSAHGNVWASDQPLPSAPGGGGGDGTNPLMRAKDLQVGDVVEPDDSYDEYTVIEVSDDCTTMEHHEFDRKYYFHHQHPEAKIKLISHAESRPDPMTAVEDYRSDRGRRQQAEDSLDRLISQESHQKNLAAVRFDALHDEGAKRFGMAWLHCNTLLAHLRNADYLPQQDRRIDTLLSECAWKMAEQLESEVVTDALDGAERTYVENMREASDLYSPFNAEDVAMLIRTIDRLAPKPK